MQKWRVASPPSLTMLQTDTIDRLCTLNEITPGEHKPHSFHNFVQAQRGNMTG